MKETELTFIIVDEIFQIIEGLPETYVVAVSGLVIFDHEVLDCSCGTDHIEN